MKNLLFFLFYLVSSICLAVPTSLGVTAESSYQAPFVLTAKAQNLYAWSKDLSQYSLKQSAFAVQLVDSRGQVVVQKNATEKANPDEVRHLSVSPDQVSFTSSDNEKVTFKAKLSKDRKSLVIDLPEHVKFGVFSGVLALVKDSSAIKQILSAEDEDLNQDMESSYSCRIQPPHNLLCTISYRVTGPTTARLSKTGEPKKSMEMAGSTHVFLP